MKTYTELELREYKLYKAKLARYQRQMNQTTGSWTPSFPMPIDKFVNTYLRATT